MGKWFRMSLYNLNGDSSFFIYFLLIALGFLLLLSIQVVVVLKSQTFYDGT